MTAETGNARHSLEDMYGADCAVRHTLRRAAVGACAAGGARRQRGVAHYLVGDAGDPDARGEPVLEALTADLSRSGAPATVVYLGDNVYPAGMPAAGAPDRPEMERRLRTQLRAALDGGAQHVILVPGNHDWNYAGSDGLERIREQASYAERTGQGEVEVQPADGCPGPVVEDVGEHVRLVLIDTEWWLRDPIVNPACPAATMATVTDSLRAIAGASSARRLVLADHHPLISGGVHGGHFSLRQHLFPLTDLAPWLWLPLPIIGSAYPISRKLGLSDQDLSGGRYRRMRDSLTAALSAHPALLVASGHDHGLQVLQEGGAAHYQLVSGAGIYAHLGPLGHIRQTLFASPGHSGYMRLDVQQDGRIRLAVEIVDSQGRSSEGFALFLQ